MFSSEILPPQTSGHYQKTASPPKRPIQNSDWIELRPTISPSAVDTLSLNTRSASDNFGLLINQLMREALQQSGLGGIELDLSDIPSGGIVDATHPRSPGLEAQLLINQRLKHVLNDTGHTSNELLMTLENFLVAVSQQLTNEELPPVMREELATLAEQLSRSIILNHATPNLIGQRVEELLLRAAYEANVDLFTSSFVPGAGSSTLSLISPVVLGDFFTFHSYELPTQSLLAYKKQLETILRELTANNYQVAKQFYDQQVKPSLLYQGVTERAITDVYRRALIQLQRAITGIEDSLRVRSDWAKS